MNQGTPEMGEWKGRGRQDLWNECESQTANSSCKKHNLLYA